jgi:hypothetical protein
MTDTLTPILVGGILLVLGGVISVACQVLYDITMVRRKRINIFGQWHCSYQPTVAPGWEWIIEDLLITRRLSKIIIKNSNNSRGYKWEGTATILDDQFLLGNWRSTRADKQAHGAFCLTIGFEGAYMAGFFLAPDVPEAMFASAFVLGRSPRDVETARDRLVALKPKLSA